MSKKFGFSMESIKQQKPDFFIALSEAFGRHRDAMREETGRASLAVELQSITKKYFGAVIDYFVENSHDFSEDISVTFFDPSQPINSTRNKKRLTRLIAIEFDTANARIKGDIGDIAGYAFIPSYLVQQSQFTNEMLASGILHELGHFYSELMMLGATSKVNPALERIAKDFDRQKDYPSRRSLILREFKGSPISVDIQERMAKIDRMESLITATYVETKNAVFHALGSDVYDQTISEYLADEFASRQGAGRALVEFLSLRRGQHARQEDRLYKRYSYMTYSFSIAFGIFFAVFYGLLAGVVVQSTIIIGLLSVWFTPSQDDYRYDRDKDRLIRIRNQQQLRMRTMVNDSHSYKAAKAELDKIDELIKNTRQEGDNLSNFITKLFFLNARKRLKQGEVEMMYEQFAHNPLFDKGMELKYT